MDACGSAVLRRLLDRLPDAVQGTHAQRGDATAIVAAERIPEVLALLRDDSELAFEIFSDLTCVDHLGEEPRFELVYHLYSVAKNHRVRIKARVAEAAAEAPSAVPLYAAADWMEREVYDLYGIRFRGHPDLRRLLLYEGFEGHPLRKDYPKEKRQPLVGPRN
jgi:NADH-quinone oxidoreductase subunit C